MIFSDLDGTLLDHDTYDWSPARPALDALSAQGVAVVLCSSKTRREMRRLAGAMRLDAPLIFENGGGVWLPTSWASALPTGAERVDDGWLVPLGTRTAALREALDELGRTLDLPLRGFGAMPVHEIATRTGLPLDVAELAAAREFSEPFVTEAHVPLAPLAEAAGHLGLQVTRGGRFFHLIGQSDKGHAVRTVSDWLSPDTVGRTLGFGDAPNDIALLQAVDVPVIVPQPDGQAHPAVVEALPNARIAPAPGPTGWNAMALEWLEGERARVAAEAHTGRP